MLRNIEFLNSKQKKKILEIIKTQFDIDDLTLDYIFLKNKDKIFLLSKDFSRLNTEELRINSLGLYFAKIQDDGIRLSIEGTQIIGDKAKKNIANVDKKDLDKWIRGENLNIKDNFDNFVIIKHKDDFFGCGKFKDNIIFNYVPKDRRIKST